SIKTFFDGTSPTPRLRRRISRQWMRCWPCVAPEGRCGRTSMRMSMCAACGKDGNEQDFLGHKPFYLPLRGLRQVFKKGFCAPRAHAGPGRSAYDLDDDLRRVAGKAHREAGR